MTPGDLLPLGVIVVLAAFLQVVAMSVLDWIAG